MIYRNNKPGGADSEAADMKGAQDEGPETFLIPKSAVPGEAKPGDKVLMEVVSSFDEEYELKYAHGKTGDRDEGMMEGMEEMEADA